MCCQVSQNRPCRVVYAATHQVHNFLEVHGHPRHLQVLVVCGVVDELRHLVQAQLLGALAKHEQHGVDDVGLAAAIGAHHGGEALQVAAAQG